MNRKMIETVKEFIHDNRPKRIAFTGAHSTGKSTMARRMVELFNVVDGTDFVKKHWGTDSFKENTVANQFEITKKWHQIVSSSTEAMVIDRSPIDQIVYAVLTGAWSEEYEEYALRKLTALDMVIVLPVVVFEEEGRIYNKEMQIGFSNQLKCFFERHMSVADHVRGVPIVCPSPNSIDVMFNSIIHHLYSRA